MTQIKVPMSTSYKAVFVLSILMIFIVIIIGAGSSGGSIFIGTWYWGYTAWKMLKRDNESLVWLQKITLFFDAIAFVALAALSYSDSEISSYLNVTPLDLIIFFTISMLTTYSLLIFFKKQASTASMTSGTCQHVLDYWRSS
jgi:hypothetical protein